LVGVVYFLERERDHGGHNSPSVGEAILCNTNHYLYRALHTGTGNDLVSILFDCLLLELLLLSTKKKIKDRVIKDKEAHYALLK
jgi:hypothetical protein